MRRTPPPYPTPLTNEKKFFLASKWSETSRNAKKFFSICEGGGGRVGGFASSEDQIGGNILSIFKFSRGKNQSCLKGAETSRNGIKNKKKKILLWTGGGGQNTKGGEIHLFFFDAFPDIVLFLFFSPSCRSLT